MRVIPRRVIGKCWWCDAVLEESYFGDFYWIGGDKDCCHITIEEYTCRVNEDTATLLGVVSDK